MTPAEALADIRGYAGAGRIRYSGHARDRMRQRGAQHHDVVSALGGATRCVPGEQSDRWKVTGPDLDGDDLTIVVALDDGAVVVTVF